MRAEGVRGPAGTGIPRHIIAEIARELGIPLNAGRRAVTIDEAWLHEQYLDHMRSTADIAAELGISYDTVTRNLTAYGIPIRPAGVHSRREMLTRLDTTVPHDIRRAVDGGLHGWHRLQRFRTAMTFPTIEIGRAHV